ncbi:MAG: hypothetical protein E6K14_08930 [Methanobacteriota archaeon]|nr:MAG: hypothetical protein E6K14_08930 [Euryarchaeota archaeon]
MAAAGASSLLGEIESAVGASRPGEAVDAAVKGFAAKTPALEVIRAAARGAAPRYDGLAPRGLAVLAAAANLFPLIQPRFHPLPTLQGISFIASERKASAAAKAPLVVSGEVTHLGRSFLFAVRAGDLPEAESIFLGMIDEGWERKMAGDMLFRAAVEDMGEAGRKFFLAVKAWQLARSLGFRDARAILRPAVQYLVKGPRDRAPYESIMSALGKEWVDLEALAGGGRPLDDAGRLRVATVASAPDPTACVQATLATLHDGYAAASITEGLAVEAAKRVVASRGYDLGTARTLMFCHAARFVLGFSRTPERLYSLFQAALRVRSPPPTIGTASVADPPGEGEALCHLAGDFDARNPTEAVARTRSYVAHGYSATRMTEVLANYAARDSAVANDGINLLLADACATEFLGTKAPEIAMALAKMIAASPKDQAAYTAWTPVLAA